MKSSSEIDHQKTVERVACIILLIYPTLMLSVKGGMNAAFLSMLLLVFVVWIHRPVGIGRIEWKSDWTIYVVAMFAMTVAIIISQAYHQQFAARHHDGASRYWLAIPVFLLLYRLDLKVFSTLPFAFPLAAIAGWLLTKDLGGRSGVSTLDLIHFGDFALMLGVLSLLSINWISKDSLAEIAFKIFGFIAGITASFGSGSRGGWLAIPLFIVVVVYFNSNTKSIKRVVLISIVGTLLSVSLLYTLNNQFQQRVSQLVSEASSLNQGDQDTSVGIRWQLYKAAGQIILDHPLFGVGPRGFALQMAPMAEAGKITPMAAELGRGEVHNDILNKAVGMGLGGLLAILAVYLVPIWLFSKASRATSSQIKRAGIMGVVFVSGFLVFGLTAEILNLTLAIAFYSFTLAVLLAYCYNTHHAEQGA